MLKYVEGASGPARDTTRDIHVQPTRGSEKHWRASRRARGVESVARARRVWPSAGAHHTKLRIILDTAMESSMPRVS